MCIVMWCLMPCKVGCSATFDVMSMVVFTGESGWFVIFEYLSPFCFLSIEFHCTFFISYKILPYFVYYYYCILVRIWQAVGTSFIRASFASFHTHASLLTIFVCFFVLFRSCCSHARVFGKTLVHEFPMSYSHTEWYLPFSRGEIVYRPKLRLSKLNLIN